MRSFRNICEQTSTRLPMDRSLYGELEAAIVTSQFWHEDNADGDFRSSSVYGGQFIQTDAARALQTVLNNFFRSKKVPAQVFVITLDPDDVLDKTKAWQTNRHPNQFIVAADAGLTGKRGKLLMALSSIESNSDFDSSNIDPTALSHDIATTIRHELVHDSQYSQVAKSMGVDRNAAKKNMEDWGLIPSMGAPRTQYLNSHIELDAFGHEFAERLATAFGVEKSLSLLTTYGDGQLQDLAKTVDLGSNFDEFFSENPEATFTRTLLKKIKKYLLRFQHHHIYESVMGCLKERKMKITKSRLRRLIREVTDWETGEELVQTSDMPGPGINVDFGAEPPRNATYQAWKFRLETDVLSDDAIIADDEDIRDLYNGWRSGDLSWDEVVDYVLDLAY